MEKRMVGTLTYTAGGLCILFFWLLFGEFAMAMRERAAVPSVLELLRQHHTSDTVMSLLLTVLPALIGLVLVPTMSYKSDRHRGRLGRRIPFLVLPTPIGALAMVGIGFCPWLGTELDILLGAASPGRDFCVVGLFSLCWTVFECVAILTLYIFNGLINDVVPKDLLGRFSALFRIVSLGAGILFNSWIFRLTESYLQEIFICVGLFFGVGFTLMCMMVQEGGYPDPLEEEDAGHEPPGMLTSARAYFKECFSHSHYLWIFAAMTAAVMTAGQFSIFNAYSQWYAGTLGMPKATLGGLTAMSFAISMVLAFFIGWLVDRSSALLVSIVAIGVYAVVTLFGYMLIVDAASFGRLYVAHVVLGSIYNTAAASLPMRLFPKARFMQFTSAAFLMSSLVGIVVNMITGPLLDYSEHNYRLTVLASSIFAFITCAALLKVRRNMSHPDGSAAAGHASLGDCLLQPRRHPKLQPSPSRRAEPQRR